MTKKKSTITLYLQLFNAYKLSNCSCFSEGVGTNCDVSREVGLAICEAMEEADKVF